MIKSMTGFGRGEFLGDGYNFKVEIKAVNHRYNDISVRMPRYMNFIEDKIKKEIKSNINRGKIDVYISMEYVDNSSLDINVDLPLALETKRALEILKEELSLEDDISITHIMKVIDVIKIERKIEDEDRLWTNLNEALSKAIKDTISMKEYEGLALKEDILSRVLELDNVVDKIEDRSKFVVDEYRVKLEERIDSLLGDSIERDDERLAHEIVIFADKCDINEELTRLKSHIRQFRKIMDDNEPIGRKLDFLIQELNREINTVGSKSSDIEVTQDVVEVKSIIEKIREQVQNVE